MGDGWRYIFGLFLVRTIIGTQSLWGMISPYAISYFYDIDQMISPDVLASVIPISYTVEAVALVFSASLYKLIGVRYLLLLSVICISGSFFIASFMENVWAFVIIFGGLGGIASGFTMMVIVIPGWKFFPEYKNSIFCLSGFFYSVGQLYGLAISWSINPNDFVPEKIGNIHYFNAEINDNFISTLRVFSGIFLVLGVIGVLLIKDPEIDSIPEVPHAHNNSEGIIKTKEFWAIFCLFFCGIIYRIFFLSEYKRLELDNFRDQELTAIGSIGAITEAISQLIIGRLYDKFDVFVISEIFAFIVFLSSATIFYSTWNVFVYGFSFAMFSFSSVYIFSGVSAVVHKVFHRNYKTAFSLVSLGFVCAAIATILIENFLLQEIGLQKLLIVFSGLNLLVFALYFSIGCLAKPDEKTESLLDN